MASPAQMIALQFNAGKDTHKALLHESFAGLQHLDCLVAFATVSGFKLLLSSLKTALDGGATARFAVGLSLEHTQPDVLRRLFGMKRVKLYLGGGDAVFHPKIYAFGRNLGRSRVIVGSSNLTAGGLMENHEASAIIGDPDRVQINAVAAYFDELIAAKALLPASTELIDEYEEKYEAEALRRRMARRRVRQNSRAPVGGSFGHAIDDLRYVLDTMRTDDSEEGFKLHMRKRVANRKIAAEIIMELATKPDLPPTGFLERYEALIAHMHSGGLFRGKTTIAKKSGRFQATLRDLQKIGLNDISTAYACLKSGFDEVDRAGINVISEVLHALSSGRYAVMNQNAVAGMRLANIREFPRHPSKATVSPEKYALFCSLAGELCRELGLRDFTELDAVFNYAYWRNWDEN